MTTRIEYKKRIKELFANRDFIWALSKKELKNKYSGSRLGIWWAVILPLLLALSISLVFTKAFNVSIPKYTFFVLSAILPWAFFSQGLSEGANSLIANRSIFRQSTAPKEIVPISSILGNFLNFIIGLAVIAPIFVVLNPGIMLFIVPLSMLLVFFLLFIAGLGLMISTANVFYRDVSCFLSLGLMVWFWITPVFYSMDMVPYPYKMIGILNPVTYFMVNFRNFLYYGRFESYPFLMSSFLALVSFVAGYRVFLIHESELSKRL